MVGGKIRGKMGAMRAHSSPWSAGKVFGGGCVQRLEICWRDTCVIFSPCHWPSSTSHCLCHQQFIWGPGWSYKRKPDPNGGTIKLIADLQTSSKPGQDFITHDWHPPLAPPHWLLNSSLFPQQQHQPSARPQRCSTANTSWFFFER